jgi:hypothetical protein
MAVRWSNTVRHAVLDAWETAIGTESILEIWSGTRPTALADSPSGTKLASFTLASDWAEAAGATTAGRKNLNNLALSTTAIAGAPTNATYYRITSSGGTVHEDGTITATGGGGDLTIDNVSIASGQTVRVTGWYKTAPHAPS